MSDFFGEAENERRLDNFLSMNSQKKFTRDEFDFVKGLIESLKGKNV